jgi:glyoxylase-like metal-dependent hydrolase (beta-lactamase superfamily II)
VTKRNLFSSKPRLACFAAALLFMVVAGSTERVYLQDASNRAAQDRLELLPVQGNISVLAGAGGNITVQVGRDGVLLVDSGVATMSEKVVEAVGNLSQRQVTYIVNTSDRSDHIGGNEQFTRIGRPLAIGRAAQASVFIIAFSTILDRMSDRNAKPQIPDRAWPNDTYSGPQKNIYFNGEGVEIFHQPATTDGDSIVLFRRSDVVSTGDLFDPTRYPVIDLKAGGSLQGVLEGLNRLRQMVIPADHVEGGTMIVPGHGRVCDMADLAVYHQMVTIVRDRLQDMIARGMTLEQIKAARPTRDFDPVYGSTSGSWTTDMFIEAAFNSLKNQPRAPSS